MAAMGEGDRWLKKVCLGKRGIPLCVMGVSVAEVMQMSLGRVHFLQD